MGSASQQHATVSMIVLHNSTLPELVDSASQLHATVPIDSASQQHATVPIDSASQQHATDTVGTH